MPPRLPLGGSSDHWCTCSTNRLYLALALAAMVWIGGFVTLIGFNGDSRNLVHPSGPHSHDGDLQPRGHVHQEHTAAPYQPDSQGIDASAAISNRHSRGFGLSKLESLQSEIQASLHNLFQHEHAFEPPTNRYGHHAAVEPSAPSPPPPSFHAPTPIDYSLSLPGTPSSGGMANPAIVVLTYKRRNYLLRTLDSLMEAPGVGAFKLYVSQDGSQPDLSDLAKIYQEHHDLTLLNHPRIPLMASDQGATAYLAQHYKWVLDLLFLQRKHSHVVIMEDDMLVSPDFLTLFNETAPLLDSDPSLWCVSSWNDNGMSRLVADPARLTRTDYFPGLGWMTNAAIWGELSPIFPKDQWDHWMRLDTTHRGRDCLIPEVARNFNIGEEGTNMGQNFYGRFLKPIAFNKIATSFLKETVVAGVPALGLEHLRGAAYEERMHELVGKAKLLGQFSSPKVQDELSRAAADQAISPEVDSWLVLYDRNQWHPIAAQFGLLPVPRSVHKGLLSLRLGSHLVYFADRRTCPYLPASLRFHIDPSYQAIAGNQNEACTSACKRSNLRCDDGLFQFVNECSALRAHFPCSKGCVGGVSGQDIPNHVDNPAKPEFFGMCLTTESTPTCQALHWSASRLCPCVR